MDRLGHKKSYQRDRTVAAYHSGLFTWPSVIIPMALAPGKYTTSHMRSQMLILQFDSHVEGLVLWRGAQKVGQWGFVHSFVNKPLSSALCQAWSCGWKVNKLTAQLGRPRSLYLCYRVKGEASVRHYGSGEQGLPMCPGWWGSQWGRLDTAPPQVRGSPAILGSELARWRNVKWKK